MFRKILDIFGIRRYCVIIHIWALDGNVGLLTYNLWAGTPEEAERRIYNRVLKGANAINLEYNIETELI